MAPSQGTPGMVAILPKTQYGLTVSSHPELLVYIPKNSSKQIFFSIKSEDNAQVYQTFLPLSAKTGIVSIKLPSDAPDLIIGKSYVWSVAMICSKTLRPDSPIVAGWVQRVPKTQELATKLQKAKPIEQLALYGEQGIWYDMISGVDKLRATSTDNQTLNNSWEQLLKGNGLSKVLLMTSSIEKSKN